MMKWSIINLHKRLIMSVTRVTGRFFLPSFAPRSYSPLATSLPSFLSNLFRMKSSTQHPKASSSRRQILKMVLRSLPYRLQYICL